MTQVKVAAAWAPASSGHPVRALVLDVAAPIAVFYGIRAAGGSVWLALAAGGIFPAASTIAGLATRRRVDVTGAVMLAALAASTAFSLISGSPRALLARDGLVTAGWAGYLYLSLLAEAGFLGHLHHLPGPARRAACLRLRDQVLGPAGQPVVG